MGERTGLLFGVCCYLSLKLNYKPQTPNHKLPLTPFFLILQRLLFLYPGRNDDT
jgi:hypothetical protein